MLFCDYMQEPFTIIYWLISGLFIVGCLAIYYIAPFTPLYWTIFAIIWLSFVSAGVAIWFLAPNIDNNDAVIAIRKILKICFILGILVVFFNLARFAIK